MRYTHIVKRASGYVAGWHRSEADANAFVLECNATVPTDHAGVVALDWDSWETFLSTVPA